MPNQIKKTWTGRYLRSKSIG